MEPFKLPEGKPERSGEVRGCLHACVRGCVRSFVRACVQHGHCCVKDAGRNVLVALPTSRV
jgi:hypothetical protein